MKQRFSTGAGSTSFFAFQDIITAVTGIMVLVALLMALHLTVGGQAAPRVDPDLVKLHAELSAERDTLHGKVAAIRATAMVAGPSSDDTTAEIQNIEDMIRELNRDEARLVRDTSLASSASSSQVDAEDLRGSNKRTTDAIAKAEKENEETSNLIRSLEQKVERAQTEALDAARSTADVWLTPDRSDTSKEPVIISVLPGSLVAQRLDSAKESTAERTSDTKSNLSTLLKETKPSDQFLVLYFKPSTLASFDDTVKAAKELGYEVGYDIIEEEGTVRFTTSIDEGETQPEPRETLQPSQEEAERPLVEAEVDIQAEVEKRGEPAANGSGFFISADGYFVTNHHVANAGKTFFVGSKVSGWRQARLVNADEDLDLALLKISHEALPFHIESSEGITLGQTVATIGFPNIELQGLSPKFTKGEISSLAGLQDDPTAFQISVPVQPGNSGGPLFDENGDIVGVVTARLSQDAAVALTGTHAENVNYAVKSEVLLEWLRRIDAPELDLLQEGVRNESFQAAIQRAEQSTAMIIVYP